MIDPTRVLCHLFAMTPEELNGLPLVRVKELMRDSWTKPTIWDRAVRRLWTNPDGCMPFVPGYEGRTEALVTPKYELDVNEHPTKFAEACANAIADMQAHFASNPSMYDVPRVSLQQRHFKLELYLWSRIPAQPLPVGASAEFAEAFDHFEAALGDYRGRTEHLQQVLECLQAHVGDSRRVWSNLQHAWDQGTIIATEENYVGSYKACMYKTPMYRWAFTAGFSIAQLMLRKEQQLKEAAITITTVCEYLLAHYPRAHRELDLLVDTAVSGVEHLECPHCGAEARPALEHGANCPVKLEFFGGDARWDKTKLQVRDGVIYRYESPGTWRAYTMASLDSRREMRNQLRELLQSLDLG